MMIYEENIATYSKYKTAIKKILREKCSLYSADVRDGTEEEDCGYATDFKILHTETPVGCRTRDIEYFRKFGDFTLRLITQYGNKTEFEKVLEGNPKTYLYCWVGSRIDKIPLWVYVDMDIFRERVINHPKINCKWNKSDGGSFRCYDLKGMYDAGCIVLMSDAMKNYFNMFEKYPSFSHARMTAWV
jgi:hypothetical protein